MQPKRRAKKLYPGILAAPNKIGQHAKLTWTGPQIQGFPKGKKWPYGVESRRADIWRLESCEKRMWQKSEGLQTRKVRGDVKSGDEKVGA